MSFKVQGDLDVCRTINAARRVNQGGTVSVLTAAKQLDLNSHYFQLLAATGPQDLIMPDASTLPLGWETKVHNVGSDPITVKDGGSPANVLKIVQPGETFTFTARAVNNASGAWITEINHEFAVQSSQRYMTTWNATTDWGTAVGGEYKITIPAATHGRGMSPDVSLFEKIGVDFSILAAHNINVLANGDVEIIVIENPDCRFAGKAVLV